MKEKEMGEQQDHEAKYKTIFDSINDAIFIHDPDTGAILEVNKKMTEVYGYTEDEARNINVGDISSGVPPYTQEGAVEKIKTAVKQDGLVFEWHCKDRSGRLFWTEVNLKPTVISGNLRVIATTRDITQRKRTEEERERLRREIEVQHARLQAILDSLPVGIWITDSAGKMVMVNDIAHDIWGGKAPRAENIQEYEIYKAWWTDTEERITAVDMPLALAIRGETVRNKIIDFERFDGEMGRQYLSAAPIRDNDGRIIGGIAIVQDITPLKQAEEKVRMLNEELEQKVRVRTVALAGTVKKLEEQKELLQTIIDHVPVIVTLCDSDGKIRLVNREFERLTGWSLDEAKSHDIALACFPDPSYREEIMNIITKAEPGWHEFDVTTRSGNPLRILWAAVKLSEGHVSIGIDITERKKMENDLIRMSTAIDQTCDGIALASPEGMFEYINTAYERISGYRRDEFIGKKVGSLKEWYMGVDIWNIFKKATQEGGSWRGRQKRKKKTGEIIDVDITITPVHDKTGKIINYAWLIRDITRDLKMQEQISQTQKMEAVGSLAGGIAHDLKNVLTPILLNAEMALEDVGEQHQAYQELEEILHAARLGKDLVQQILTFGRRVPQKKEPVDISKIIRESLTFLRSTLPSTIDIHEEVKDECVMAVADPTQIKQVLINLGSNASQAIGQQGGVIDVSESIIDLSENEASMISPDLASGAYIQVRVCDTGQGMDGDTMRHIFEPFFTTRSGEGTGLGLSVVHGIVKDHKGAITVSSSPDHGATFTVLLPMMRDQGKCRSNIEKIDIM